MLDLIRDIVVDRYRRLLGQFLRFAVVGALNTVLDFAVYLALTRGTAAFAGRYVLAASVSFVLAAGSSFLMNTFWTFRGHGAGWHKRAPKFFAVALGGLCWNALILASLTGAGVHDILAKLVATGIVLLWNFTLQKTWTFRA